MAHLLEVDDLSVRYAAAAGDVNALNGVTFAVRQREIVGVLGESGSGKTTLGLAVLGLLPPGARVAGGSIRLRGRDVLALSEAEREAVRGAEVAMIFQEPDLALNPFLNAIDQVQEVIGAHYAWTKRKRRDEARRTLSRAGLDKEPRLLTAYPHQLSGGERQRLVVAQALACRPALLIADEPTASLDPVLQLEWVRLIKDFRAQSGLAVLLITHDPAILPGFADRVVVLYSGRVIEEASTASLLQEPLHPYTRALLRSMPPEPGARAEHKRLPAILPLTADAGGEHGCAFAPFCADRQPVCSQQQPPEFLTSERHRVRCWNYRE